MKKMFGWFVMWSLFISAPLVIAVTTYEVEVSHNDELFIINGEKFEAKTYCFNMNQGDRVIFLKGNPNGICSSAEILNLRTENVCRVWCE